MEGTIASCLAGGRKHPQQEFLQVDTTNICSSAAAPSAGWRRSFPRAAVRPRSASAPRSSRLRIAAPANLPRVEPEDLLKYGLIRVRRRLPVVATLATSTKHR